MFESNHTDIEYINWANNLNRKIAFYGRLTLLPIGLVFNILSIIVFQKRKFKNDTMGFYNIMTSVINVVLILMSFVIFFSQLITDDILLISNFSCKFFSYSLRLVPQWSSWLNVFVTVDRMISLTYPYKYNILKDKVKLLILIVFLFVLLAVLNLPNLLFKLEIGTNLNSTSHKHCMANYSIVRARDIIVFLCRNTIPFFLMIIMNSYLIYKLIKFKIKYTERKSLKRDFIFSLSIMALNILFLTSFAPNLVALIYLNALDLDSTLSSEFESEKSARALLFLSIGSVISTLDFCFNFFINLVFNKLFRAQFILFVYDLLSIFYEHNMRKTSQQPPHTNGIPYE